MSAAESAVAEMVGTLGDKYTLADAEENCYTPLEEDGRPKQEHLQTLTEEDAEKGALGQGAWDAPAQDDARWPTCAASAHAGSHCP